MPGNKSFGDGRVIKTFVNELLMRKGVSGLDVTTQDKLMLAMMDEIESWVEHAILMALPHDRLVQLNNLMDDNGSSEEIDRIFDESGVDFDQVTKEALASFREAYLANGDNQVILDKYEAKRQRLEAMMPEGTGHEPELDAAYAAGPAEQLQPIMAMAGGEN